LDDGADERLADLVTRAKRRDAAAFAALIRRYERTALGIAYAHLGDASRAGDAVQEAFLKAWQKLADLAEPGRFAGWLGGIVRNVAIDLRRKSKPSEDREIGSMPDGREGSDPVAGLDRDEQRRQIDSALAALDEVSRSAVVLRYYENLSSREIGELLGITAAAVDMRLSRARQQLRTMLSEDATV
jgi:RNA polymerase sigma-70 factor, ECF subfamily